MLRSRVTFITLSFLVFSGGLFAQTSSPPLNDQIQSALNAIPGYGVFDYLTFKMAAGGKVILVGEITTPDLKSRAEKAVQAISGVAAVENDIEALPTSRDDDAVRKAVYNAVYGGPTPSIYAAQHSIHILVRNAEVTLEGTVKSDIDRTLIASAALGAGNVYSLTNHLVALAQDSDDSQWRRNLEAGLVVDRPAVPPAAAAK